MVYMIRHLLWPTLSRLRSTISIIALMVTLASVLVTLWRNFSIISKVVRYGDYWDFTNADLTQFVAYIVMAGCSLIFLLTRHPKAFRIALGVKLAFFTLYILTIQQPAALDYITVSIVLTEIIVYEAFWINIIIASLVGLFWIVIPLIGHGLNWGMVLPGLLMHTTVIVPLSMLIYYRERYIQQQEKVRQMDRVVSRLTQTNLGYQTYAEEASARSELEERQRITRELHDIIGYTFTNNIMMMEAAYAKILKEPERVASLINLARENAAEGLTMIRKTLYQLRETEPIRPYSMVRFMHLINLFEVATQIEVGTELGGVIGQLPIQVEDFMYYFIQAGLTNAFVHGGASKITIQLSKTDQSYHISIQDNGCGAKIIKEGIGMSGMRERLAPLGGKLEVMNNALGFIIQSEIPVAEA